SVARRLDLGKDLVNSGDDLVAAAVFGAVLTTEPGNLTAQLGLAQVHIHQYLPGQALPTLASLKPTTAALCRQLALVWAEYPQVVGEYVEARQRYHELLARDPDPEELLRNGLQAFLQTHSELRAQLEPCLGTGPGEHALTGELKKLATGLA